MDMHSLGKNRYGEDMGMRHDSRPYGMYNGPQQQQVNHGYQYQGQQQQQQQQQQPPPPPPQQQQQQQQQQHYSHQHHLQHPPHPLSKGHQPSGYQQGAPQSQYSNWSQPLPNSGYAPQQRRPHHHSPPSPQQHAQWQPSPHITPTNPPLSTPTGHHLEPTLATPTSQGSDWDFGRTPPTSSHHKPSPHAQPWSPLDKSVTPTSAPITRAAPDALVIDKPPEATGGNSPPMPTMSPPSHHVAGRVMPPTAVQPRLGNIDVKKGRDAGSSTPAKGFATPQKELSPHAATPSRSLLTLSPQTGLPECLPDDANWGDILEEEEEAQLKAEQKALTGTKDLEVDVQTTPVKCELSPTGSPTKDNSGWAKRTPMKSESEEQDAKVEELMAKMAAKQRPVTQDCVETYVEAVKKVRGEQPVDSEKVAVDGCEGTVLRVPGEVTMQRVVVGGCRRAKVMIIDAVESVEVHGCEGCTFFIGCAAKEVTVRDCKSCTFYAVAGSVDISNSTTLNFSLYSTSVPTHSASSGLTFCPFMGSAPLLLELPTIAGLDVSLPNCWSPEESTDKILEPFVVQLPGYTAAEAFDTRVGLTAREA